MAVQTLNFVKAVSTDAVVYYLCDTEGELPAATDGCLAYTKDTDKNWFRQNGAWVAVTAGSYLTQAAADALYSVLAHNHSDITGAFKLSGDISPAQITTNQNDYNPTGLASAAVLRLNVDAARTITGLAGGDDGRLLMLVNTTVHVITLPHDSASSTAANRFHCPGNTDFYLRYGQIVWLYYDTTTSRWRISSIAVNLLASVAISVDANPADSTAYGLAAAHNHGHRLNTYNVTPVAVALAGAIGTSTTAPPRGDHGHAHGSGYAGGHTDVASHLITAHTGTLDDAQIPSSIARDSETSAAIAALSSVYQPLDGDLTSIAALTTTSYGRGLLALADQAAMQTALQDAALSGVPKIIRKGTDTTRSATTTLADDPHLIVPVVASAEYFVEFYLRLTGANTAMDAKFDISKSAAGMTVEWGFGVAGAGTGFSRSTTGSTPEALGNPPTTANAGSGAVTFPIVIWAWVTTTTNAGNIVLQWAQNTSDAGNLTMTDKSFARRWRHV